MAGCLSHAVVENETLTHFLEKLVVYHVKCSKFYRWSEIMSQRGNAHMRSNVLVTLEFGRKFQFPAIFLSLVVVIKIVTVFVHYLTRR